MIKDPRNEPSVNNGSICFFADMIHNVLKTFQLMTVVDKIDLAHLKQLLLARVCVLNCFYAYDGIQIEI